MNEKSGKIIFEVLIGIIVTVFISVIFFVSYFAQTGTATESLRNSMTVPVEQTAQPNKIEDVYNEWKTYKNSKYALEFKYPPSWSISRDLEVKDTEGDLLSVEVQSDVSDEKVLFYFQVSKRNPLRLPISSLLKSLRYPQTYKEFRSVAGVEATSMNYLVYNTINFTKGIYFFSIKVIKVDEVLANKIFDSIIVEPPILYLTPSQSSYLSTWKERDEFGGEQNFFLKEASLGYRKAPGALYKSTNNQTYKEGEEIYALTLNIDVYQLGTNRVPLLLRRMLDESEASVPSNTREFVFDDTNNNSASQYTTHTEEVIFVVPEHETSFSIRTGGYQTMYLNFRLEGESLILDVTDKGGELFI